MARALVEALKASGEKDGLCVKKGRAGVLEYQVGAYEYEEYWETNNNGKRRIHDYATGFLAYVALKVVEKK